MVRYLGPCVFSLLKKYLHIFDLKYGEIYGKFYRLKNCEVQRLAYSQIVVWNTLHQRIIFHIKFKIGWGLDYDNQVKFRNNYEENNRTVVYNPYSASVNGLGCERADSWVTYLLVLLETQNHIRKTLKVKIK